MAGRWLVALVLFGALATPAQATVRKGTGTDPSGDARGGNAGNDVIAAGGQADDATGQVVTAVGLAGPPASYVVALVGTRNGASCGAPFVLFEGQPSSGAAVYVRDNASSAKTAQMTVDGNTVGLGAADAAELALPFDCVIAGTSPDGHVENLYDETDALIALAADAPPPPAATPAPTPAATVAPAPATTKATTPPVAVPQVAKLTATLGAAPRTIRRNRTLKLKLVLTDDGAKPTRAITVTVARARGLSVSRKKVKVKRLKPAQKRTVTLRLKLTKKAKKTTKLKVTARAGKLKATTTLLLRIGKARKRPPSPAPKKSPIVGTYWWRTVNHVDYAWDNRALYFVDDGSVYSGFPAGGLPTTCTAPPAKPDQEIDQRDGCLPYTYDEKTGALTVGDKAGTYKPGSQLVLDGNQYSALQIPAAGATFGFNEHRHWSFTGLCGLITGCSVTKKFLTLTPTGEFVLSSSTTATLGDPGIGGYVVAGNYPPDQHGTYAVLAGGRIHLAFADGTARDETFAVLTHDENLQPDPVGEGVILGPDNFYPDSD